jgi:hypothetical protein
MRYFSLAACFLTISLMPGCNLSSADPGVDVADNAKFDTCMRACEASCRDNSMTCSIRRNACENSCAPNASR